MPSSGGMAIAPLTDWVNEGELVTVCWCDRQPYTGKGDRVAVCRGDRTSHRLGA